MASCDDDFALLGDDAQSQPQHQHQHQHQHQQAAGAAVPFAHRYIAKAAAAAAAATLPLRSRTHAALNAIASPKKGAVGDEEEDYGEAFAQADASKCPAPSFHDVASHPQHHCFSADANPFVHDGHDDDDDDDVAAAAAPSPANGGNNDGNPDRKPRASSSHQQHRPQQQHQHHPHPPSAPRPDPKRRNPDDPSDGESPYCYGSGASKKTRPMSSSSDYRKDREEWSDTAIDSLLDAYTERFEQLNRGNLRGRDWEDVATIVSDRCDGQKAGKSVEQCKNKIDNLKKRYKVECQRLSSGGLAVSHWPWFKKMEHIIGNSSSSSKAGPDDDKSLVPITSTSTSRQQIKSLSNPRWKRVVLKISGASLAGAAPHNVDPKVIMLISREIQMANRLGVQVAVVVGGRNIFCGDSWVATAGIDRATTYQISMMASVMNAVLLQASLEKNGVETRVQTALTMPEIAEPYVSRRAMRHLEKGRVVIFGGIGAGIGNPLFTTDTAAALRASEINADAILKGTTGDGLYSCHPRNGNNVPFEHISYRELVSRGFTAMDMTAITFCEENDIPVVLFNLLEPGNISRALCGDQVGTLVDQSGRIN
ncbi:uncharacterized protein LOC109726396 isoform X2 [Ananas comosus]|uniref:UMP kinase n=1 Tax=Ananas comosus TaxID=4615 RepID=A0A6P5H0K0_ANACO|nr:uncharacterized protein LOC109726396 isoform X2 [Ananas comosus]